MADALPAAPVTLFRTPKSGHCHRVELMLALLGLPYETVDLDMTQGAHKAPGFLMISPLGQVPAIDDNGTRLSDSNAILVYLAARYGEEPLWTGISPAEKAEVQRWLGGLPAIVRLDDGAFSAAMAITYEQQRGAAAEGLGDQLEHQRGQHLGQFKLLGIYGGRHGLDRERRG